MTKTRQNMRQELSGNIESIKFCKHKSINYKQHASNHNMEPTRTITLTCWLFWCVCVHVYLCVCVYVCACVCVCVDRGVCIYVCLYIRYLTWKNLVWNLVNAQPIRRSSSCRASTLRASFSLGVPRFARAALISFSVIAEKWARNTTCNKIHILPEETHSTVKDRHILQVFTGWIHKYNFNLLDTQQNQLPVISHYLSCMYFYNATNIV